MSTVMDISQIQEILPHRFPFLMVDRITELEIGKRVVGIKNVTINEGHFVGHYPHRPIMPGVLIVEAMAQVGGIALMEKADGQGQITPYLGALDSIRFRRPVVPGDQLRIEVGVLKARGRIAKVKATATVDGEIAAEGELTFALVKE